MHVDRLGNPRRWRSRGGHGLYQKREEHARKPHLRHEQHAAPQIRALFYAVMELLGPDPTASPANMRPNLAFDRSEHSERDRIQLRHSYHGLRGCRLETSKTLAQTTPLFLNASLHCA